MDKIKTDKTTLRKFGLIMASGFSLMSLIIFTKYKYAVIPTAAAALFFILIAIFAPALLKYIYIF